MAAITACSVRRHYGTELDSGDIKANAKVAENLCRMSSTKVEAMTGYGEPEADIACRGWGRVHTTPTGGVHIRGNHGLLSFGFDANSCTRAIRTTSSLMHLDAGGHLASAVILISRTVCLRVAAPASDQGAERVSNLIAQMALLSTPRLVTVLCLRRVLMLHARFCDATAYLQGAG